MATAASGGQTTSYAYDPAGNVVTTTLPSANGHVEERTYDPAGRLTRVKTVKGADTLVDFTYTLDPVGNPTQVVRAGSAPGTTTYAYDARDRLTEVCFQVSCPGGSDPFIRWTYDAVGNRLTEARPLGTTSYTYDAADELTQAGSTTYGYDQNGNQTSAGSTTLTYDLANRLKTHAAGNTTTTYGYDGDGVRLQASTGNQASKKTNFLWDGNHGLPQLALERDGNNALLRRYVYGKRRIWMTASGATSYYHYDNLGSVANLTSSTGATQWTWTYEPFGTVRTETKASGAQPTNFTKSAGEYLDPTGLYHLRVRHYDPVAGRFLTLDPVAPPTQSPWVAPYVYVANRPTVMVDPSGMTSEPCTDASDAAAIATSSIGPAQVIVTPNDRRCGPLSVDLAILFGGKTVGLRARGTFTRNVYQIGGFLTAHPAGRTRRVLEVRFPSRWWGLVPGNKKVDETWTWPAGRLGNPRRGTPYRLYVAADLGGRDDLKCFWRDSGTF